MLYEAPIWVIATLTGDAVQLGNGRRAVGAILSARCNGELTQSSVTYGTRDTKRGDRVLIEHMARVHISGFRHSKPYPIRHVRTLSILGFCPHGI